MPSDCNPNEIIKKKYLLKKTTMYMHNKKKYGFKIRTAHMWRSQDLFSKGGGYTFEKYFISEGVWCGERGNVKLTTCFEELQSSLSWATVTKQISIVISKRNITVDRSYTQTNSIMQYASWII